MINFLVLLGWAPKENTAEKEIYALTDLINEFDLSEVGKSPAIFDTTKLDFFNGFYIRQMDLDLRKVSKDNHVLYYSAYDRFCNVEGCLNRIPGTDNALTTLDEDHITPAAGRYLVEGLNQEMLTKLVK